MKWTHLAISVVFGLAAAQGIAQGGGIGKGGKGPSQGGGGKGSSSGGGNKGPSGPPPSQGGGIGKGPSSPPPSHGGPTSPPPFQGGGNKGPTSPPPYQGGPQNPPSQGGGIGKGPSSPPPWHGGPASPPPFQGGGNKGPISPPPYQGGGLGSGQGGGIGKGDDRPIIIFGPDGSAIAKSRGGRPGQIKYGGTSNNLHKDRNDKPISIERAPINPKTGSLQFQVRRQERINVNRDYWRRGYYHYDRGWNDDCWFYGRYAFTPIYDGCVISPWYYYAHMPGYLLIGNVYSIDCRPWLFTGNPYRWNRIDGSGYYSNLDYAIDDLVNAFERLDRRALGRLVPRKGRVNIAVDGQYAYSVEADDFYDMMLDLTQSTQTESYHIADVRTYNGQAEVVAEHEFTDPWGRRQIMYHSYRLEQERGGYVIRDFGSSSYRYGY